MNMTTAKHRDHRVVLARCAGVCKTDRGHGAIVHWWEKVSPNYLIDIVSKHRVKTHRGPLACIVKYGVNVRTPIVVQDRLIRQLLSKFACCLSGGVAKMDANGPMICSRLEYLVTDARMT
jgi:hypothetical protein